MFRGSMVALVTPMKADTSIDWQALHDLVDWHLEQGTHGIVAVGTTGESPTLAIDEHIDVIRRVVDQVAGRVPVIAGTGANSTTEAVELTKAAKDVGVDACLLVTPYYNKPSQDGLYQHYAHVAQTVDIPQILYNVPSRTAVDLKPQTVGRLSRYPNIIGIKEATGDLARLTHLKPLVVPGFILLSGDDETAFDFLKHGGHGEISVTANVAPAQVARMCDLIADGELEAAKSIHDALMPLHKSLFLEANPIPVKWVLEQMGKCESTLRLPLTRLDPKFQRAVKEAMQRCRLM
ncbi:4-hydroxy-tetrahydrodipicolinate synthase [Marinagarivorans algicola]|uniref:4-hydroxy-tetrahydrodipicolinate synthase n=1 Tax=Marinagarivorans algicola TaxID=1513270 RepID=UPI0006B471DD|nr:4-hydroxy-tetrahydrodipicolinate synthase [Marinagarivorans algicola]